MKRSVWDILAFMILIAMIMFGVIFLQIFINPQSAINPFPPPTLPPTVGIPTQTPTSRSLPPTWTVTPGGDNPGTTLKPTSTLLPSATSFRLPTFTPTVTATPTATRTPKPTRTPTVTNTPPHTRTPPPIPGDQAVFIKDVTVPKGTKFIPEQTFIKTWRLENSGFCTWTPAYAAVFERGERMGDVYTVSLVSNVLPRQRVEISVDMKAPATLGKYKGYWLLRNQALAKFGLGAEDKPFTVEIEVIAPTPTPTPTETATPPPP
ncbi:MAG: NBR1-Ig-like domain-containing protein [Anaerolineaceae bacterium]|nr:NBR1-Ig-like domain-containing protein [Anaerolineaceae bacterium]